MKHVQKGNTMPDTSLLDYFREQLAKGEALSDPFEDAVTSAQEELSDEEKEALRLHWNNQIRNLYGGEEELKKRMFRQRAARAIRVTRSR